MEKDTASREIERKFLVNQLPSDIESFPSKPIEQAYLCTQPVIRVRREGEEYYLTYKGKGFLSREEHNLLLTKESYEHLLSKADGNIITKRRYFVPMKEFTIELDIFEEPFKPLMLAEVEFSSEEQANSFLPPEWLGEEVTYSGEYQNSTLSQKRFE